MGSRARLNEIIPGKGIVRSPRGRARHGEKGEVLQEEVSCEPESWAVGKGPMGQESPGLRWSRMC